MATKQRTRPKYNWLKIRARYESGETAHNIAKGKQQPTQQAIDKRAKIEGWSRHLAKKINEKVVEKVVGIVGEQDQVERDRLIDRESTSRADVELRHRSEIEPLGKLLNDSIGMMVGSSETILKSDKGGEEIKKAKIQRVLAGSDMKFIRPAMDALSKKQEMERKAWRLDEPEKTDENAPVVPVIMAVAPAVGEIQITIGSDSEE